MHAIAFRMKRAHLRCVGFGREMFETVCEGVAELVDYMPVMTPARFDLMHVIGMTRYGCAEQLHIRWALGLSSSTISKMVTRLVDIGLLHRERSCGDARRSLVRMTELGMRAYRQALQVVFGGKKLTTMFETIVGGSPRRRRWRLFRKIITLCETMDNIAARFSDATPQLYDLPHEHDETWIKDAMWKRSFREGFRWRSEAQDRGARHAMAEAIEEAIDNEAGFENALETVLKCTGDVVPPDDIGISTEPPPPRIPPPVKFIRPPNAPPSLCDRYID